MPRLALALSLVVPALLAALLIAQEPTAPAKRATDFHGDPLPAGAKARLGALLYRSGAGLMGLAFTPDGKQIFSANSIGPIRCWDAATGKVLREIDKGPEQTHEFVFSADARAAASIGFHFDVVALEDKWTLRYWDLAAGESVWQHSQEERLADHLCISPDGTRLAFSGGRTLHVWDAVAGVELVERKWEGSGKAMAFSTDGKLLAYEAYDKLHVWDWSGEADPRSLAMPRRNAGIWQIAFSPDAANVAVLERGFRELYLFDVAGEKKPQSLLPARLNIQAMDVSFSPEGQCRVRGWDGQAKPLLWDATAGKELVRLDPRPGGGTWRGAIHSPDGSRYAEADENGPFYVWNAKTGELLGKEFGTNANPPYALAVLPGGKQIVTGTHGGVVTAWEIDTGKILWRNEQSGLVDTRYVRGNVGGLAASPDGKWLASTSGDGTIRLLHAADGKERFRLLGHASNPGVVAFSTDSLRLASCDGMTRQMRLFDMNTGKALSGRTLNPGGRFIPEGADPDVRPARGEYSFEYAFSGDARRFAIVLGMSVYLFDGESDREIRSIELDENITQVALSPDGGVLAVCQKPKMAPIKLPTGKDHTPRASKMLVRLYDAKTGKQLRELDVPGYPYGRAEFSADGLLLAAASAGTASSIRVWRVKGGEKLHHFACDDAHPVSLALSPDNQRLISGMNDTSVLVWDLP